MSEPNKARVLAEKIVDRLCSFGLDGGELPFVESLISEALQAAVKDFSLESSTVEYNKTLHMQARAEAFEEAAKIADALCWEDYGDDDCLDIAGEIRRLKEELNK